MPVLIDTSQESWIGYVAYSSLASPPLGGADDLLTASDAVCVRRAWGYLKVHCMCCVCVYARLCDCDPAR